MFNRLDLLKTPLLLQLCCCALFACINTRSYSPCLLPPSPSSGIKFGYFLQTTSPFEIFCSLVLLSLEIHTFKTPNCMLSVACLICCSISFSALSKCNLVPLIPTQSVAPKIIVLLCHLDHVSAVLAILQQADYFSTFYSSSK